MTPADGVNLLAQLMDLAQSVEQDQVACLMLVPAVALGGWVLPIAQNILLAYAGIKSFRAIQSPLPDDDKQWLTFWLIYSLFDLVVFVADLFLWVVPFYGGIKLAFLIFLGVLNGAVKLYPLLEPFLLQGDAVYKKYEPMVESHLEKLRQQAGFVEGAKMSEAPLKSMAKNSVRSAPTHRTGRVDAPPGEGKPVGETERALFCDVTETLDSHNALRALHGAPPLVWSDQCARWAAKNAIFNSDSGQIQHKFNREGKDRVPFDQGQNVFWQSNGEFADAKAAKEWYSEISNPGYDFSKPGTSPGTGYFTQVVWHETTHVGMARSPCGCYVVANYWPPGNWMVAGEFEANVQRPDPSKYAAFKQQEDEAAEAAKVKCQKCAQAIPVGQAYMPTPQGPCCMGCKVMAVPV